MPCVYVWRCLRRRSRLVPPPHTVHVSDMALCLCSPMSIYDCREVSFTACTQIMSTSSCAALAAAPRDFRALVGVCPDSPAYAEWEVHNAIVADDQLRILVVSPCAPERTCSEARWLHRARAIVRTCATDPRIFFEKSVPLRTCARSSLIRAIFGGRGGRGDEECKDAPLPARLHAFAVRIARVRIDGCERALREAFPSDCRGSCSACCNVTRHHEQALLASQILFHEASLSLLRVGGPDETACASLAANLTYDLQLRRGETSRADVVTPLPPRLLLPTGMAIDSGGAMELMGLRRNDATPRHVSLVYDAHDPSAAQLLHSCSYQHAASKSRYLAPGSRCRQPYISHNNQINLRLHEVSQMGALVHDPRAHAYCNGVKLLAPRVLLAYRRRRAAKFHFSQDGADLALLENWTAAEVRACAAAGGRTEGSAGSAIGSAQARDWAAPRCV